MARRTTPAQPAAEQAPEAQPDETKEAETATATAPETAPDEIDLSHGNKRATIHMLVKAKIDKGLPPTAAFASVGEQVGIATATVATHYYKHERETNPNAPRATRSKGGRPRGSSIRAVPAHPRPVKQALLTPAELARVMDDLSTARMRVEQGMREVAGLEAQLADQVARMREQLNERENRLRTDEDKAKQLAAALAAFQQ